MTPASERDPVQVGILGVGAITQVVHLPILSERPDVDVIAVSDPDRLKAETLGARFEVPRVLSNEEILSDGQIQAAVICTPNHLHESLAVEALERGKHVLVEKPLAMRADGVRRVLDAAAASGRHLAVGMHHRFRPDVGALTAFVAGGELGDIYTVRANSLTQKMPAVRSTWRQKPEEAGGGALMDLGVPTLDLAFWLVDYPRITRVTAVFRSGEADVEEAATVFAVSESGHRVQRRGELEPLCRGGPAPCPGDGHRGFRLPAATEHQQTIGGTAHGRDAAPTQGSGWREPIPKRLSPPSGSVRAGGSW